MREYSPVGGGFINIWALIDLYLGEPARTKSVLTVLNISFIS